MNIRSDRDIIIRAPLPSEKIGKYGIARIISIIGNSGVVKETAVITRTVSDKITHSTERKKPSVAGINPKNIATRGDMVLWFTLRCIRLMAKNSNKR